MKPWCVAVLIGAAGISGALPIDPPPLLLTPPPTTDMPPPPPPPRRSTTEPPRRSTTEEPRPLTTAGRSTTQRPTTDAPTTTDPPTTATPSHEPLDLALVMDISGSGGVLTCGLLQSAKEQLEPCIHNVRGRFSASQFALATFSDLPIWPFGTEGDHVYEMKVDFGDVGPVVSSLDELEVLNGGDRPEAQLHALKEAARGLSWREEAQHILTLVTDADMHISGHGQTVAVDYPTIESVSEELKAANVGVVFLVPEDYVSMYEFLLAALDVPGMVKSISGLPPSSPEVTINCESSFPDVGSSFEEAVYAMFAEPTCHPTPTPLNNIEILLLLDNSYTFKDHIDQWRVEIPEALAELQEMPEVSVGMASFVDKPLIPFGYPNSDYCYWQHAPIGASLDTIRYELDGLSYRSGNDWHENQLGALYESATNPGVGWSKFCALCPNGPRPTTRIVLLVTDAGFHKAGDGARHAGLPAFQSSGAAASDLCTDEDYPSIDQVRTVLWNRAIFPIYLVPEGLKPYYDWFNGMTDYPGFVDVNQPNSVNIRETIVRSVRTALAIEMGPIDWTRN